jgi:hypothetical protein
MCIEYRFKTQVVKTETSITLQNKPTGQALQQMELYFVWLSNEF